MNNLPIILREQLIGKCCDNFRFVDGGTLIFYFKSQSESSAPFSATFWVDCGWRLRYAGKILVASLDSPDIVLSQLPKMVGLVLTDVKVDEVANDIYLSFSDGFNIDIFGYSTQSELWEFRRSDGYRLGAGPDFKIFERWETDKAVCVRSQTDDAPENEYPK